VKPDPIFKKSKLTEKVAGFVGYAPQHIAQTDWQMRKYLAGELEKVRDRLVHIMVNRSEPDPLQEKFGYSLKTLAYLKEELAEELSAESEDRLLDADLILLEKVEALHTPLDMTEAADSTDRTAEALDLFDEGLAEVDDLFQKRCRLYQKFART
jgi:hypothetical protein